MTQTLRGFPLYLQAFGLWLSFLACAVACGAAREFLLTPRLGDTLARAVCTVFLCLIFLWAARWFVRRGNVRDTASLLGVGLFWCLATLAFEFGFGLARGLPLSALLADYDLFRGRLWPLVPITLLSGPYLSRKLFL
ncbi:hypothetical protein NNJEOMEG_02817 [Fundidesulfovibrio magnetotacticus]|uniref:Uncharacterized protein n=1 Tax=Fundidesulfovibrio magnetotacticus TaxID=2730080 RepID=A0A6V8LY48_9BACT|nr:hypothetical protein [Fundidesulfovibrio magnetotacticus]GFK94969.1 hypothetical protein NNJEOMEG_02817 [Fundidesulfovibrio magnetotacticus]